MKQHQNSPFTTVFLLHPSPGWRIIGQLVGHQEAMNKPTPNPETRIALFQHKEVRRTIHNNEWWFVITDSAGESPNELNLSHELFSQPSPS